MYCCYSHKHSHEVKFLNYAANTQENTYRKKGVFLLL